MLQSSPDCLATLLPPNNVKPFALKSSYRSSSSQEIISPGFFVWLISGILTFPGVKTGTKFYAVEKLVSQTTLTSSHLAPSGPGPPPSQISIEPHSSPRGKAVGAYAIAREPVTLCVNVTCLDITGFIVWN